MNERFLHKETGEIRTVTGVFWASNFVTLDGKYSVSFAKLHKEYTRIELEDEEEQ